MCDGTLPLLPNFSVDSGGEGGLGFSPLPWALSVSFYWISSVDCSHLSSLPSQVTLVVKNLPANAGDTRDTSLIPGSGRSSGEVNGWQPTPVFLPGESHGQRSLAGYSPWVTKSQTRLKRLISHTDTHTHTHTHAPSAFTPDVQHCSTSLISHKLIQGFYQCSTCHWRLRIWWEMAPSYPINPRVKYQVLLLLKSPVAISIYLGSCHVHRLSSLPLFSPLSPQILVHYLQ